RGEGHQGNLIRGHRRKIRSLMQTRMNNVGPSQRKREERSHIRILADQAFARAAGAPLVPGNSVRLLRDARENYPAWIEAIRSAERTVHFESYIIHEDEQGRQFAELLAAKAREGVRVRLIYDWMGALRTTSGRFWRQLRASGVEVRCFNPPRAASSPGATPELKCAARRWPTSSRRLRRCGPRRASRCLRMNCRRANQLRPQVKCCCVSSRACRTRPVCIGSIS